MLTPSESESDIASLITCGPTESEREITFAFTFARCGYTLRVEIRLISSISCTSTNKKEFQVYFYQKVAQHEILVCNKANPSKINLN